MESMDGLDYLVVGHVCQDITPVGKQPGGSAAYCGGTAHTLGCRTAVLTSAATDYPYAQVLTGCLITSQPAPATTTFENVETPNGRQQTLHARAETLNATSLPPAWQRTAVVHLAPIANEIDEEIIYQFSNSMVGLTPQGWLRQWDNKGRVSAKVWPAAPAILPLAAAVILSEKDLLDAAQLAEYRQWTRLLVLTKGANGCTIFHGSEVRDLPAPTVTAVETTGAGDIFATAFLLRLYQTDGNPWEAGRFANWIAAHSVTQAGLTAKLEAIHQAFYH